MLHFQLPVGSAAKAADIRLTAASAANAKRGGFIIIGILGLRKAMSAKRLPVRGIPTPPRPARRLKHTG
jgi:hypothetical protein